MAHHELVLPAAVDAGALFACLSEAYTVHMDQSSGYHALWLDTADWRLARGGASLCEQRRGTRRDLVLEHDGTTVSAPPTRVRWPESTGALAASPLRKRLRALVGPRAVLPLAECEVRVFPLRLLDALDKTRVRGTLTQYRLVEPHRAPLASRLSLEALRGYSADADRAEALVRERIPLVESPVDPSIEALRAAGHRVGHFAGQGPVQLDPDASAATAVATILLDYADVVAANRDAAASGLDSESLHDLRVAVRASRGLLRVVADLLPNDLAGRFAPALDWLAQITSRPRTLDVADLLLSGQGPVPVDGLGHLAPLREMLHRRRRSAIRAMADQLRGSEADTLLAEWRDALRHVIDVDPPGATVAEVAAIRIKASHRELVGTVAATADEAGRIERAPAAALHKLRRRAKRLRYLVHSTQSLAEPAAFAMVSADLKHLQDLLGTIQDDAELRAELMTIVTAYAGHDDHDTAVLLDAGALLDRMRTDALRARSELPRQVRRLSSARRRQAFAALIPRAPR